MGRIAQLRERAQETLWIAPLIGLLVALLLATGSLALDGHVTLGRSAVIGFGGEDQSARSILSTIAASMLTFLALSFTLTVVALQLATNFSSRLLRYFLTDRPSKVALALFVATFTYSVLVLRDVSPGSVPEVSVTVATVMAIAAVVAFIYYVSSVAQSLRIANIVERAGGESRREIEAQTDRDPAGAEEDDRSRARLDLERRDASEPTARVTWDRPPGVVIAVDMHGLGELAEQRGATIELLFKIGEFLPEGASAITIHGSDEPLERSSMKNLIGSSRERSASQDPAFGIRQLVDIAARALSPGVNDPTTAVQAVDHIHDLLLRLGSKSLRTGIVRGEGGELLVFAPVDTWEDYVRLAVEEIRLHGAGSLQVARRLNAMLGDLHRRLPACRSDPLEEQARLLATAVSEAFALPEDRRRAHNAELAIGG